MEQLQLHDGLVESETANQVQNQDDCSVLCIRDRGGFLVDEAMELSQSPRN